MAIDNCKASVFDAADLAYVKDEGTIMRKLLSAFSIRPTVVVTKPVTQINSLTPHIAAISSVHITTLPIINVRIPINANNYVYGAGVSKPVNLKDALEQDQIYIHHRTLSVKSQQIQYSRELLIFYVHRRHQQINYAKLQTPYIISSLPNIMNHFEILSEMDVIFPDEMDSVGSGSNAGFTLKSVVAVQTTEVNYGKENCDNMTTKNIIIGCTALVRTSNNNRTYAWKYEPMIIKEQQNNVEPMKEINEPAFKQEAKTRGTLFIYQDTTKFGKTTQSIAAPIVNTNNNSEEE